MPSRVERLGQDDVRGGVERAQRGRRGFGFRIGGFERVVPQDLHQFVGQGCRGEFDLLGRALQLVDLALQILKPRPADGCLGSADQVTLQLAHEREAEETVKVLERLALVGV